jgi:hypothetical protein
MKKFAFISFAIIACLTVVTQLVYAADVNPKPSTSNGAPTNIPTAQKGGLTSLIPCTVSKGEPGDLPQGTVSGLNCNSWNDLIGVIQFFINSAMKLAVLLATVSFAYAGWLYLTSNGDMGKVKSAHDIFLKVLKGFLFMGLAYLLVKFILSTIANSEYSKLQ